MLLCLYPHAAVTINLERLDVVLCILNICVLDKHGNGGVVVWVCCAMLLKSILQGECCFATLVVKTLHFGMRWERAGLVIGGDEIVASVNGTDTVEPKMLCAETVSVVRERISAAEFFAAWKSHIQAVADNNLTFS